jgi:hypothetical protein
MPASRPAGRWLLAADLERLIAKLPPPDVPAEQHEPRLLRRIIRELRAEELTAMITDYQAGATLSSLAATYGYNRVGISGALKQAGIQIRRKGLTPAQADEAERLYGAGQSLATVAARYGVDAGTVRTRLIKRGVVMRPASQRG